MTTIPILLLIIFFQMIIILVLWQRLRQAHKKYLSPDIPKEQSAIAWLNDVMRDPNPFLELTRFAELAHQGQISPKAGSEVVRLYLRELHTRGQLRQLEIYNAQVPFDPNKHRSSQQLQPGDPVVVLKPGWQFRNKIIKYPVVQRQKQ